MGDKKIHIKLPATSSVNRQLIYDMLDIIVDKCLTDMTPIDLYAYIFALIQFLSEIIEDDVNPSLILYDMIHDFELISQKQKNNIILFGNEVKVDLS